MKIKIETLINYSIISFGLFPIIPNKSKGLFIVIIFLISLNYFILDKKKETYLRLLFVNSILLFSYIFSLLYTSDLSYAFRKLGPGISIIIFPLIFTIFLGSFNIKKKVIDQTLKLFSISTLLYMIIFIMYLYFVIQPNNLKIDYLSVNYLRYFLREMPVIGRHPIYASLYIGVSIIYLISQIYSSYKKNKIYFFTILIIFSFLAFSLFLISSKSAIIFLLVTAFAIGFNHFKSKLYKTIFITTFFISLVVIIIFIPRVNSRFKELLESKTYSSENIDKHNSSQIRVAIWQIAFEKIKTAPLLGYGIGDVKSVLSEGYKEKSPALLENDYNSHNQYLGIWLGTGLIGLILFLYFLYFNNSLAFNSKDVLFLAIVIFFSLHFLTENILERQTGAILFFFLINLFSTYNYKKVYSK